METINLKEVTLLVTHYNRSKSLERLLATFAMQGIVFGDIVVSDDGSKPEQIEYLKQIQKTYPFRLIGTEKNAGLGNNINKGQKAVNTPFTLYVQEDFVPMEGYAKHLQMALLLMEEDAQLDLVRFYAYFKYPYLKPVEGGFSEMKFNIWLPGVKKFHVYSDHPHLRRSSFLQKFGDYREGIKGDKTEFLMAMSFIKHKGKALFYENYKGLFDQKNSTDEPSTMKRANFRQSGNWAIGIIRTLYRYVKHTGLYLAYKA